MERKLLTLFLSLFLAISARAQVRLIIDRPLGIAQEITNIATITDDGTWGFGADTTGPVTAPVFCVPGIDSFACQALTPGSLAGKIAIVHRGPDPLLGLGAVCGFGTKALNCQNAGAVGILMIYEPRDGQANDAMPSGIIGNNGTNSDGLDVHIPVIVISRPDGRRLKPLLCDSGIITMGGFLAEYSSDLRINPAKGCISPPAAAMPNFLIRDTGQFAFTPSVEVLNMGNQPQASATATVKITRFFQGNTDLLYEHTLPVPAMSAATTVPDTAFVDFPHFDIATAVPGTNRIGIYTLQYAVTPQASSPNPNDDVLEYVFQITEDKFSLARLDNNGQDIISKDFVSPALDGVPPSNRVYRYGVAFETKAIDLGDSILVKSVRFGVRAGDTVDFTALNINAELFEWADADDNGGVSDAELNQIGNGLLTFDDDSMNGKLFTVSMEDLVTGASPVLLAANKRYLVLMTYRGDDIVSWSFDDTDDGFSYFRFFEEQRTYNFSPLFVNQWFAGYVDWPVAALRVDFDFRDNGTPLNNAGLMLGGAVTLSPNPAHERFRISVSEKVARSELKYELKDLSGRVLKTGTIAGAETQVSTAGLAPGLYQVRVFGGQGSAVRKLAIR